MTNYPYEIYLETGKKKVFAIAVDWPGWCRSGRDEQSAILALLDAGPRYAQMLRSAELEFIVPETSAGCTVVARVEGNATTDFGAPDGPLSSDWEPIDTQTLDRLKLLLQVQWLAFDRAVNNAEGKPLRKGPRGGGRDLTAIVEHVVGAEESYVRTLGWKLKFTNAATLDQRKEAVRAEVLRGLDAAAGGQIPREGPRGGKRWPPRFFVRRLAWHLLDHVWEIEDRIVRNVGFDTVIEEIDHELDA
jgi:hypothetical protein